MAPELNFGPYVDFEDGKKVVKDLTFGNPTPEGVVLTTLDSAVNWMRKGSIWPMAHHALILRALGRRCFGRPRGRAI
jgi:hypothetical protein